MVSPTRILLADDERHIRSLVRMTLGDGRFEIAEANDGASAVAVAASFDPALIIIDQSMPGMNGREAVRQMRAVPQLARVPIIMLTANDDEDLANAARVAGVDTYLLKPFSPLELLDIVERHLAGGTQ